MVTSNVVDRPFTGVHGPARRSRVPAELPVVHSLLEVVAMQRAIGELFVRFSDGPETDETTAPRDPESGYVLPGLPAWPLRPEGWWSGTSEEWIARQVAQHAYLLDRGHRGWLLTGRVVGRGPGCEPLVARVKPVATLAPPVRVEAETVYASWRSRLFR